VVDDVTGPESSAERVALWRALHVELDAAPHVLDDVIGLQLAAPQEGWRDRPDMDPEGTRWFRAGMVARARFVEDLVARQAEQGVTQYVVLGAGLDSFAQRRPELAARLRVFEVDQPAPQAWKEGRLMELGFGVPEWLRFVPVDFEGGGSWLDELVGAGFDPGRPAVVVSTGVTLYLSKEANAATLRQIAGLAPGSTLAVTFLVPADLVEDVLRPGFEASQRGAAMSGTPFVSFYAPDEIVREALAAGFATAQHVSSAQLNEQYFAGRSDGLRTARGVELLVATT
jgi:methyltransferase (TIGR00027 family)